MEKKYEIQGVQLTQTELCLDQDIELLELFDKVKDKFGAVDFKKLDFRQVLRVLTKERLLDKLIGIVLQGEVASIKIGKITNSELEVIVTDFFEFNAGFVTKLKDWVSNLALSFAAMAKEAESEDR